MPKNTPSLIDAIRRFFPACATEASGKDGQIQFAIDFNLLRQELFAANQPIRKTFRPCIEESLAFETTQNLLIEDFKNAAVQIDNQQVSASIPKVQERQNCPMSSYLNSSGECKYKNDSVDNLHSSFSRMADKKITIT